MDRNRKEGPMDRKFQRDFSHSDNSGNDKDTSKMAD